jgi:exodeoxyribonuclease-3
MNIATFNVNSIRSRLEIVKAWTEAHRPDVLCLQETKAADPDFPREAIEAMGYQVRFRGEPKYNGVAVLSRRVPDETRFGFEDGGPADEARLTAVRFGSLTVVNTYVPQGREITHDMYRYKLEWFARLRRWFERHFTPGDLVVWVGDLNVAAGPEDVHRPEQYADHVCFHADVRRAFADCRAWGFEDVFRKFHPEPGRYSFFDYRTPRAVDRNIGWRLDYILATRPLAAGATGCDIDVGPRRAERPSDHTVVHADFRLPEGAGCAG